MKLMTLNIWGGYVREPLLKFIEQHQDIDIFCLQEIYKDAGNKISRDENDVSLNIFSELSNLLPDHKGFFRPVVDNIYGIGMFVNKNIDIRGEGDIKIYDNPEYSGGVPTHSRNLQWLECSINHHVFSVFNVHGLWNGKGKTDTPDRILQSQRIKDFIDTINTPKILCGDLNLRPDTEIIKIIEARLTNLITKHKITSTRSSLYPKAERFADYIFTSEDIVVKNFKVLDDIVSDHLPLVLDFTCK